MDGKFVVVVPVTAPPHNPAQHPLSDRAYNSLSAPYTASLLALHSQSMHAHGPAQQLSSATLLLLLLLTSPHAAVVQHVVVHQAGSVDHLDDFSQPPVTLRNVTAGTQQQQQQAGTRSRGSSSSSGKAAAIVRPCFENAVCGWVPLNAAPTSKACMYRLKLACKPK